MLDFLVELFSFFGLFGSYTADVIAGIVVAVCCWLFWVALKKDEKMRDITPALMVSAGIIGTFWGTFIALSEFSTIGTSDDWYATILRVLSGMKSAFVTSLIGLVFAFYAKVHFHRLQPAERKEDAVEKGTRELLEAIRDGISGEGDNSLSSQIQALAVQNRDDIREVNKSLSGDSGSSVVTQLINFQNDSYEQLETLNHHMEGLAKTIRESLVDGMKSLVDVIEGELVAQLNKTNEVLREQLGDMVKRIEEALIEQFGQTFIQFNEATQAIRIWQEQHREQVEQLTEAFNETAKGIEKIRQDCETIPATMESLKDIMQRMESTTDELNARLQVFADMAKQADEFFPTISEKLEAIGTDLQKSADGLNGLDKEIKNVTEQVGKDFENMAETYTQNTQDQMHKIGEAWGSIMVGAVRKVAEEVENIRSSQR